SDAAPAGVGQRGAGAAARSLLDEPRDLAPATVSRRAPFPRGAISSRLHLDGRLLLVLLVFLLAVLLFVFLGLLGAGRGPVARPGADAPDLVGAALLDPAVALRSTAEAHDLLAAVLHFESDGGLGLREARVCGRLAVAEVRGAERLVSTDQ